MDNQGTMSKNAMDVSADYVDTAQIPIDHAFQYSPSGPFPLFLQLTPPVTPASPRTLLINSTSSVDGPYESRTYHSLIPQPRAPDYYAKSSSGSPQSPWNLPRPFGKGKSLSPSLSQSRPSVIIHRTSSTTGSVGSQASREEETHRRSRHGSRNSSKNSRSFTSAVPPLPREDHQERYASRSPDGRPDRKKSFRSPPSQPLLSSHAVYARVNREKRKQYFEELEQYRDTVKKSIAQGRLKLQGVYEETRRLSAEIDGLRRILMNNKPLTDLLKNNSRSYTVGQAGQRSDYDGG